MTGVAQHSAVQQTPLECWKEPSHCEEVVVFT